MDCCGGVVLVNDGNPDSWGAAALTSRDNSPDGTLERSLTDTNENKKFTYTDESIQESEHFTGV